MTTGAPPQGERRARLANVVATMLRVPVSAIGDDTTFSSLGVDSLVAVELTASIEDALQIELPLSAVHEHPTLDALCRFIEQGSNADARFNQMLANAVLPDDIRPSGLPKSHATHILLTGATGFLGAYILRELLDTTSATIHCLIRGDVSRIRDNLEAYGLYRVGDLDRVRIVAGDLSRGSLGLSPAQFLELSNSIDAIIHGAADVNWVRSYESLRATNVVATRELLRLACMGTPKPFHFVSSTSVCHSTAGPRVVDERTDVFAGLRGLRLGYAQSKCVAEALVREAGIRGLPTTIIRPSLLSGAATTGKSNVDDLTSRFIAGCIRMHAAPDLDWRMDCVPVDDVASAIVRFARLHDDGFATTHLVASKPRHWRECVLWMRTCGYEIELLPYAEWCDVLRATTDRDHPLAALRSFFLDVIADARYLTLPELFEESRRSRVDDTHSSRILVSMGTPLHHLDSRLLGRYFHDFVSRGVVPRAPRLPGAVQTTSDLDAVICRALSGTRAVTLTPLDADESIVAELTAWRAGAQSGLFDARVVSSDGRCTKLFVKAKPADTQMIEVAEAVAALASSTLGDTISRFRNDIGLSRAHIRELEIYRMSEPRLRAHMPGVQLIERDDESRRWILGIESLDPTSIVGATDLSRWDDTSVSAAVDGLAEIHSAWFGRASELRTFEWMTVRDSERRVAMTPLWAALAEHAHDHSAAWSDHRLRRIHTRLVDDVAAWSRMLDETPHTLIHNDFNTRNIALRRVVDCVKLCAFDWELATVGSPQRDLAEFLCFALPPDASCVTVARWVERHRVALSRATNVTVPRALWERGFGAALADVLVDRLSFYAMIERVRPQPFLTRVTRSWLNLFRQYPC